MLKKLLGLGLLTAVIATIGFAGTPAQASGCACSPCGCGQSFPCE